MCIALIQSHYKATKLHFHKQLSNVTGKRIFQPNFSCRIPQKRIPVPFSIVWKMSCCGKNVLVCWENILAYFFFIETVINVRKIQIEIGVIFTVEIIVFKNELAFLYNFEELLNIRVLHLMRGLTCASWRNAKKKKLSKRNAVTFNPYRKSF